MTRPDIEYMTAHGFETAELALVSMLEKVEKAEIALAAYDELAAENATLRERSNECVALTTELSRAKARILELEEMLRPDTVIPPPTVPENAKPESEG